MVRMVAFSNILRHNTAWTFLSQRLLYLARSLSLRRSLRPSGKNSEKKRVFQFARSVLDLFSILLPRIGFLVGVLTLQRKLKPNTNGCLKISLSMIKLVLILSH